MCVVGAYLAIQAALSAWDAYTAYETIKDSTTSLNLKIGAVGFFVAGLADPVGGGYGGTLRVESKIVTKSGLNMGSRN